MEERKVGEERREMNNGKMRRKIRWTKERKRRWKNRRRKRT
jgi:hypothetical protein